MPENATLSGDGFRFYRWEEPGKEPVDLLSVTSLRKLAGEPYRLVRWQIANVVDVCMSTRTIVKVGPRGGISKVKVKDEYPGEFMRRMLASEGEQGRLDEIRKWVNESADEPRNMAARRGSIVHKLIEKNVAWDRIERPIVEQEFMALSARDRKSARAGVTDEDVLFVRHAVRNYADMRKSVPFVIVAREPQVFNLTAGYGGSADTILWFLPEDAKEGDIAFWQKRAFKGEISLWDVESVGGYLAVGDWKTAEDIHTDNIVQITAYGAGEFIGSNGIRDNRLTELLNATTRGVVVHIRPDLWDVGVFDFTEPLLYAMYAEVRFARFLAQFPEPKPLFTHTYSGKAEGDVE